MKYSSLGSGGHDFQKQNMVTQNDRRSSYDTYKCTKCGMIGKRRGIGSNVVEVSESYTDKKVKWCGGVEPQFEAPKRVKVSLCTGSGRVFANLTPGSIHEVVTPPEGYKNDHTGVWVQGVGEPCKLLTQEFERLE